VGFGLRQLVDIAERALSPGVNDPTTAKEAVNEVHVVLRGLAQRPDVSPYLTDQDGEVRAIYRPQTYAGLLRVAVEELVHYGADASGFMAQVRGVLEDLLSCGLPAHASATRRALEWLSEREQSAVSPPAP